jgi:hypothetical protein
MRSTHAPWFIDRQVSTFRAGEGPALLQSAVPRAEAKEFSDEARAEIIFCVFINAVERLEGLLDRETAMLIGHQPIALEDFNHKKRHGLLELIRAMDAMRGFDRDFFGRDAKETLAQLRVKLQKNLAILRMHMDAVGAIAAIIAQAIQEYESDGTYTPYLGDKGGSP